MLFLSRLWASMEMPRLMGSRMDAISFTQGKICGRQAGRTGGRQTHLQRG